MRVALIGPPQSGKSSLFAAIVEVGGSHIDLSRQDQPHLAIVKVPDERLTWLMDLYKPEKTTPAELEFLDLPGLDLRDDAGRNRAKTHWAAMRQSDMLVFVVRAFENPAVSPYRNRVDAGADVEELLTEMIFADLEQVTNRIEKLNASIKRGGPERTQQLHELDLMKRLLAALEAEKPINEAITSESDSRLLRSFAFLSLKPALVVLNCAEGDLATKPPAMPAGLECMKLSAAIEQEIARLSPQERSEFLESYGLTSTAGDRMIRQCYRQLKLISFLTAGEDEVRAWTIQAGTEAVTAAGEIHSDIARGFIRAETVSYEDLRATGDMKVAKAAGKIRLEGKNYIVSDGDIINFRFNV